MGRAGVKEGASRKRDRGDGKKKTKVDVSREGNCVIRARLSSAPTKKSRLSLLPQQDGSILQGKESDSTRHV